MDKKVSEAYDCIPVYLWVLVSYVFRQMIDRFTDDAEIPFDGVQCHV